MTKIHVPLKFKVKRIQQKYNIPIDNDPEIKDKTLSVNLSGNKKYPNAEKENVELRQRVKILEQSLQEAREEAFQSGIDEGKEQLKKEMESLVISEMNSMKSVIEKVSLNLTKEIKKIQPVLLSLSKKIASKIIDKELSNEDLVDEILLKQIGRILHELMDQETITIHVAPSQIEWIIKSNIEEEFRLPGKIKIKFYEDRNLKSGECILESTNLLIEGKFQEQLNNIEAQLQNI